MIKTTPNLVKSFLKTLEKDNNFNILNNKINNTWNNTSRQKLNNMINNGINTLKHYGVKNSDRVAYKGRNTVEWVAWNMSCYAIGAIWVPMYHNQSSNYCNYILQDCKPKVLITNYEDKFKDDIDISAQDFVFYENTNTKVIPYSLNSTNTENMIFESHNDIATLIYTSGTSGNPKGVMLSHENILSNLYAINNRFSELQNHQTLNILPWAHIYSLTCELYYNLLFDNTTHICSDVNNFVKELNEVKPNSIFIVPKVLEQIKKRIDFLDKPIIKMLLPYVINRLFGNNLDVIFVGGAKLDKHTKQFYLEHNINICEGYGTTETSPLISVNHHISPRNTDSIGKILDNIDVSIINDEICVAGPNVMQGYWNNVEATNNSIHIKDNKRWYKTGDSGRIENGFLFYDGRISENYKLSNGKFVNVSQVENNIRKHLKSNFIIYGENRDYNTLITDCHVSNNLLKKINNDLDKYTQIKYTITVNSDKMEEFLTPKMSIKRKMLINYVTTFDLMK